MLRGQGVGATGAALGAKLPAQLTAMGEPSPGLRLSPRSKWAILKSETTGEWKTPNLPPTQPPSILTIT